MNLLGEEMKTQKQKSHCSKKKPTTSAKKEIESNITLFFQQCKGSSRKLGGTKWLVKNN
jgi:hypothetical protein